MAIRLVNNTSLTLSITDMGLEIPASGLLTINSTEVLYLADSVSAQTLVSSGDLSIDNDSGLTSRALAFNNSSNGFISNNVQEAIEEASSNLSVPLHFNNSWMSEEGDDEWLSLNDEADGDKTFFVVPFDSVAVALTWSNEEDDADVDIEIYRNGDSSGDKIFTWVIRNSETKWKTNGLSGLTFLQGDRIGVFSREQGEEDDKPVFQMYFKSTSNNLGEGGT